MLFRIFFLICFALVVLANGMLFLNHTCVSPHIGAWDFAEYWTANQLFIGRHNPYDPALLLSAQQSLGRTDPKPLMMWNPPWTLTLLRPVLMHSFEAATHLWLAQNFFMAFAAAIFGARAVTNSLHFKSLALSVAIAATFFPVTHTIILGQISLLIALGVAGLFWALCRGRDWWAGAFLTLLSVKPHLVLLVLVALAVWTVRTRRYAILISFFVICGSFMLLTWQISPTSFNDWIGSMTSASTNDPLLIPTGRWITSTFASDVRTAIVSVAGVRSSWPLLWVPLIGIAITFWFSCRKNADEWKWQRNFPPLLCFSLFMAPFAWDFDSAVLIGVQSALVALIVSQNIQRRTTYSLLTICLLPQLFAFTWKICGPRDGFECCVYGYGDYSWLPVAVLAIWWLVQKYAVITQQPVLGESLL